MEEKGTSSLDSWLKWTAQRVQDSAREAAEKASFAAKRFATDVKENTRATADAAEKTFKRVVTGVESMRVEGAQSKTEDQEIQERVQYGIGSELLEFLDEMTLQTFRDFPDQDTEQSRNEDPGSDGSATYLTDWQEKHAILVLQASPRLNNFRYRLVPSKMSDRRFWDVYFRITDKHLEGGDRIEPEEQGNAIEKGTIASTGGDGEPAEATPTQSVINTDPDSEAYLQDVLGQSDPSEGEDEDHRRTESWSNAEEADRSEKVDLDEELDMDGLGRLAEEVDTDGEEEEEGEQGKQDAQKKEVDP